MGNRRRIRPGFAKVWEQKAVKCGKPYNNSVKPKTKDAYGIGKKE